jgi:prepilin-type processing-associated H-X9-DG protein
MTRTMPKKEFGAIMGLLCVGLMATAVIFLPYAFEQQANTSCAQNLKRMGLMLKIYSNESIGEYLPPMKTRDCDGEVIGWTGTMDYDLITDHVGSDHPYYERYGGFDDAFLNAECPLLLRKESAVQLWDEGVTEHPDWKTTLKSNDGTVEPCEVYSQTYMYTGYAHLVDGIMCGGHNVFSAEELENLSADHEIFQQEILREPGTVDKNWVLNETLSIYPSRLCAPIPNFPWGEEDYPSPIFRLREPIARDYGSQFNDYFKSVPFCGTISSNSVVTMHESPDSIHAKKYGGAHVLFLDGHVEYVHEESGEFPYDNFGKLISSW